MGVRCVQVLDEGQGHAWRRSVQQFGEVEGQVSLGALGSCLVKVKGTNCLKKVKGTVTLGALDSCLVKVKGTSCWAKVKGTVGALDKLLKVKGTCSWRALDSC